tara:strand:- start:2248 stop:2547 length:300 start_codon:yes stop_codon:yes gene_type:complete
MGYLMATTNKELLDKLTKIEGRISNGKIKSIYDDVKDIKEILLDPEDGVIVRVNKNTYWRRQIDPDEFKTILRWRSNITHGMWVVYSSLVGIIIKLIFW